MKESENAEIDKKRRKQKNYSLDQDVSQANKTPQVLGKALGKVSRVLRQSPRKRKAVLFSGMRSHKQPIGPTGKDK